MARPAYITASTLISNKTGEIGQVNFTKAGSADAIVTLYDNNAASGTKIAEFTGALTGTFNFTHGNEGTIFTSGLYVAVSGTTAPVLTITLK